MNPFSYVQPPKEIAHPKEYFDLGADKKRGDKDFIMSRSELMRFNANPWKWIKGASQDVTKEMEYGSLLDCMFTAPSQLKEMYDIYPETYPTSEKDDGEHKPWNMNAKYCQEWRDKRLAQGITPIKMEAYEGARQACARLMEDGRVSRLMSVSKKQVMVIVEYKDKATGLVILFKMLLDIVPDADDQEYGRLVADLKSTQDASVYEWEKTIFYRQYHVQSGCYIDGMNAAIQKEHYSGFLHVISESSEPYAVGRRILSDEFIELGRSTYRSALKRYCASLVSGKWSGYDDDNDSSANPILDGWRLSQPSAWMIA